MSRNVMKSIVQKQGTIAKVWLGNLHQNVGGERVISEGKEIKKSEVQTATKRAQWTQFLKI